MSNKADPIFKSIFAEDWDNLPIVFKKHYANLPFSNDKYDVYGHLDVMCKGLFRLLSPVLWLLKGVPPKNDKQVDVKVTFRSSPDSNAFHFDRHFSFSDGKTYRFHSKMRQLKGNQVVEIMPFGLGWRLQYKWENHKVVLKHQGYALCLFGKVLPLPLTWILGSGYAEETAINDHEFEMFTHITHPLWGKIYGYRGKFKFKEHQ